MKRIIAIAALAALAACSKPAEAPAELAAVEATPTAAAETLAADGKPSHGQFKVTLANGDVVMEDVRADGTLCQHQAGRNDRDRQVGTEESPNSTAPLTTTPDAKQKCHEEKVDDKGVYTSKDPETGEVATVVRVELRSDPVD